MGVQAIAIQISIDRTNSAAELAALNKDIASIGTTGATAGAKAGDGIKTMGGHAATGLDSVRLLSQEFGLRMPLAIEAMLSRMPAVTNALSSVVGIMAGVAGVEIFSRAIEGAKRMYDEFISLNAILDKYNENIEKARLADLPNSRSIETTQLRLRDQTQSGAMFHQQADEAQASGLAGFAQAYLTGDIGLGYESAINVYQGHQYGENANSSDVARDALSRKQIDDAHQQAAAQIELNHAQDATLTGAQKINAEATKKKEIAAEIRTYENKVDKSFGNEIAPDAGVAAQQLKNQTADGEAAAQKIMLGREISLAIMKADDQRIQAGLQGEELFHRKMLDDIRELTRELNNQGKAAEIPARVREINEKYFDDMSERAVKAQNASGLSIRRSQSAGLNGAARIYADQDYQVNENNTKLSGDDRSAANEAAAKEANTKLLDLQIQFVDSMDAIGERWVDSTLSGYDRIDAEATKSASDIKDKFSKAWSGSDVDQSSAEYVAAKKAEQDALTDVQRGAATKRSDLSRSNQAEDLRYDQQAAEAERRVREQGAMGWVASYRDAITEIQAAESANLAKLANDAKTKGLNDPEIAQREVDIHREAAAQIEQQQIDLQHKVSNTMEAAFKDPIGTIKSTMEKLMFDLLAQWVLHFKMVQALFGSAAGGASQPGLGGVINNAVHGGGSAAQIAAQVSGAGGAYRPAYAGSGAAAPSSSSGIVGGGASASSIGGDISTAQSIAGLTGFGSSSADAAADVTGLGSVADTGGLSGTIVDQTGAVMPSSNITNPSGINAMGVLGAAGAAYSAEQTTVSAFDQGSASGVLSGTMGDAAAGAAIGSIIPGIGTAIGAGIGAAVGFASGLAGAVLGMGGRIKARDYYKQTLFPQLEADRNGQGGDAMSAISDVNRIAFDGYQYMATHFGAQGATWVKQNYLDKEVALTLSQITAHAQGGQQYTTRQAMQFHTGGYISDFGDFGTSGSAGLVHALMGETMMNQSATATHAPVLNAMNDGASSSDVASMYLASSRSGSGSSSAAPADAGDHYHFHTLDTGTMETWLRQKGARMISKAQNNLAGQYSGDGVIG